MESTKSKILLIYSGIKEFHLFYFLKNSINTGIYTSFKFRNVVWKSTKSKLKEFFQYQSTSVEYFHTCMIKL